MAGAESGRLTIFQAAAVEDRRLGHAAFRVLAALGRHSDKHGWCWPKQEELARALGISRQAVGRSIGQLEALGYIVVYPQRDERTKVRTGTRYRLVLDMVLPADDTDDAGQRGVAQPPTQRGSTQQNGPTHATKRPDLRNVRSSALTSQGTTQLTTQGDGENNARPPLREIRPILRPRELEAAAQADSPSWAALVREADSLPVLGAEHERWTATWRGLQDWAARAGLDDAALVAEIHARARRYRRQFTTPYTTPALGANWAALAHDPPPRPEGAPARASPGDTEALIAAQPKLTRANIEAGRRFLERRGHGLRGIPGLPDPAGGRDEQVPERRADRAVVADVRALPPGDGRDGGRSGGG